LLLLFATQLHISFTDPTPSEIYTLSLHDALPILWEGGEIMTQNLTSPRRSLAMEYAYSSLKKQIINGTLLPNQSIVEQLLSKELEVSRTPLREAIQRLEFEGLLIRRANEIGRAHV